MSASGWTIAALLPILLVAEARLGRRLTLLVFFGADALSSLPTLVGLEVAGGAGLAEAPRTGGGAEPRQLRRPGRAARRLPGHPAGGPVAGHKVKLRATIRQLDATWQQLRPQLVKAGGATVARAYDRHVTALKHGGTATATQKQAVNGLDVVDRMEGVSLGK